MLKKECYTKSCFYCGGTIRIGIDRFCPNCGCEALESMRDMAIKAVQEWKASLEIKKNKKK